MSSINAGNQNILWRYRTPLKGGDLAQMHSNILVPGVYTGMGVAIEGPNQVKVDPGEVMIQDASPGESRIVKISFSAATVISLTPPNKFLVLRYTWRDSLDHYAEFLSVNILGDTDLLIAAIEYRDVEGGYEIQALDTASRVETPNELMDTFFGNLKPSVAFTYHRSIQIAPGNFSLHGTARASPGDLLTFDASSHANGRWDTVGTIDGTLLVYKGTEGGSILPPGDFFPVCHVHIRKDVEYLLGTDIVDARPFFFYSHGIPQGAVSYQDLTQGFDNEYGVTTPSKILDVSVAVSGRDALVSFSPQANLTNLLGYHIQVSPDAGTSWYPLGPNGYDGTRPGATSSFYTTSKEIKGLPHGISSVGTAIPKDYQVRVRQVTAAGALSPWSEPVPFSTAPYTIGDIASGSITDAALAPESMAAKVVSNFSSSNDRIATVPASPTTPSDNSSVDHTDNMDNSVNISFEWVFDGIGDAYDIDGFVVYVHQDASPIDYTFGSDPSSESVYYVNPDRRALIMYGAPKDKYYSFGVQAYRVVDIDISPSGLLSSAIVKPSGSEERPYNPQVSAAYEGDIGSTVVAPPALTVLDTTAPDSGAASLIVTQEADGSITVSWSGFTDTGVGIFGYKVLRKYGASQMVMADLSGISSSYNDSNVEIGNSYQYSVAAYDRNGNECPQFAWTASVTSAVSEAPPAPAGLTAVGMTGYVDVSFAPVHAPHLRHYRLYRSNDGGATWPTANSLYLTGTTYFDFGLTDLASIRYKVQAILSSGHLSLESPVVSASTTSFTPASGDVPADILSGDHAVTDMADGTMQLHWPLVTGASLYRIFRKRSDLTEWVLQATVPGDARPFVDVTVEAGKSYQYAVRAVSSSGIPNTGAFSSNVSNVIMCTDSQAPVIPALNVTPLVGAVRLSWTTDYRIGTRYHLYRCSGTWDDLNAVRIALLLGSGKATWDYTDAFGADVPLNFSYKMRVEDMAGNLSGFSPVPSLLTSLIVPEFPGDATKVLHWSFDDGGLITADTVTDTSRTNSDGRTQGTVSWVPGKSGTMIRLSGQGYIKSATGCELAIPTATAVSYSMWVSTYVSGRYLFLHGTEDICGLDVQLTTNGGALVTLYNEDGIDGLNTSWAVSLPAGTFVDSMDSYQLVVDNSTQRLFVYKGGFYGSSFQMPGPMKMPYGSYGLVVVGADATGAFKLIGDVDELMIFASALQAKHVRALHQFVTNGALGSVSAIGTRYYRLPGAPSTVPVPASILIRWNANATMDVTLFWQQYYHGAIPANFLTVFRRFDTADPGIPDYADDSTIVPVNLTDVGSFVFAGLTPDQEYSFGIAAGRNTENGALLTVIATDDVLEQPVWVNVNSYEVPNFTGTVDGIDLAERLDDFSETLFGVASPPSNAIGKDGDLYHNTDTSMEWVKVAGGWTPANLGAVSVTITGGTRTMAYNAAGLLQTTIAQYGLDIKRNGITVTPSAYSWNAYGCLQGTGTGSTFTPNGATFTNGSTYVRITVTIDSVTYIDIAPVAVSQHGADGTSVTIVGSVPTLLDLPDPYTGDIGDGYVTEDDGHLHIWDGVAWDDVGEIRGPQGSAGADGEDGSAGVNARSVSLTSSAQGIVYNTAGGSPNPTSVTVTATAYNTAPLVDVYYRFLVDDDPKQHTTSNQYTYNVPTSYANMPDKVEVEIREGSTMGTLLAKDILTIYGLKAGANALTVMLTNEAHTLPTTVAGSVTYAGSGTAIRVWEGTTQLTVDQNSPYAAGSFRVSAAVVSGTIVIGAASGADGTAERVYGVPSGMTTDVAVIRFTITVTDLAGVERTAIVKDMTLTKSWQGTTGLTGATAALFSISNAGGVFTKALNGTLSPSGGIVLTTTVQNFTGVAYVWKKNTVNISGATATSYTVPTSDFTSATSNTYQCVATGTINGVAGQVLSDSIIIGRVDMGSPAPTVQMSNGDISFPAPLTGYSGIVFTAGVCDVTAYIGATALTYAASGANTFSCTNSSTGATVAAGAGSASKFTVPVPTAMSVDSASTDVVCTLRDATGTSIGTTTVRITYSLSRQGTTGTHGTSVFAGFVYRQLGSAPTAPTGGTYNFSTAALTAPTDWTTAIPTGSTTQTYVATFIFSTATPGATVTAGTWVVAAFVQSGTNGAAGLNGMTLSGDRIMPAFNDPTFLAASNGLGVYNNGGGGTVTHTREAKQVTSPFASATHNIKIVTSGIVSPGAGGFINNFTGRANAVFVQRFVALIPVGYNVVQASNAIGDGATHTWITAIAGTGKFEEYILVRRCGATGTFSSSGHIYLNATNPPTTTNTAVTWYLAFSTVYDLTSDDWSTASLMNPDFISPSSRVTVETDAVTGGLKFRKTAGTTGAWDAFAQSRQRYEKCTLTFRPSQANLALMFGLDTIPGSVAAWTDLDYVFYLNTVGVYDIREAGATRSTGAETGAYTSATLFQVSYDGANVRYLVNGTVVRTVAVAGQLFYLASAFATTNAAVTDVSITPTPLAWRPSWASIAGMPSPALNIINSDSPSAAGLFLGPSYMGYYNGSAWKTYMQSNGNFLLSGSGANALSWDGSVLTINGRITVDATGSSLPAATITGTLSADRIAAGSIAVDKLTVLPFTRYLMNPRLTGNVWGWGNVTEAGVGTPVYATYDSTEQALKFTIASTAGVRSVTFPVGPNEIYRVSGRVKKSAAHGILYVGLSAFTAETAGYDGTASAAGSQTIVPITNSTRASGTATTNYYVIAGLAGSTAWTNFVFYIIGSSVANAAYPSDTTHATSAKMSAATHHVAVRFLNWSNTVSTSMFAQIDVVNLEQGKITASAIQAGTITATQIDVANLFAEHIAITGSITVGSPTSVTSGIIAGTTTGVVIWAGATTANRAAALFRVTANGVLTASSGTVGGWTLAASSLTGGSLTLANTGNLTAGTSNNVVRISANDATYRLWIGHATAASAPFRVTAAGAMYAKSGEFSGTLLAAGGRVGSFVSAMYFENGRDNGGTAQTYAVGTDYSTVANWLSSRGLIVDVTSNAEGTWGGDTLLGLQWLVGYIYVVFLAGGVRYGQYVSTTLPKALVVSSITEHTTLHGDIKPALDNTADFGTTTRRFLTSYFNTINIRAHLVPTTDSTSNIGTYTDRFAKCYVDSLYAWEIICNGTPVAVVSSTTASTLLFLELGSIVAVRSDSTMRVRNSTTPLYLHTTTGEYTTIANGTALAGTWRCSGATGFSSGYWWLYRRVA